MYWIAAGSGSRWRVVLRCCCSLAPAVAFGSDLWRESDRMFLNANFLGAALIASAAVREPPA